MSGIPRKRRKVVAEDADWGKDDPFAHLTADDFNMFDLIDSQANNHTKVSSTPTENSASSTNRLIMSQSLLSNEVIAETPIPRNNDVELLEMQLNEFIKKYEEAQVQIKLLTDDKNLAVAEAQVRKARYDKEAKDFSNKRYKMKELLESKEKEYKLNEDKYRKKIESIECDMKFKNQELLNLRLKCEKLEKQISSYKSINPLPPTKDWIHQDIIPSSIPKPKTPNTKTPNTKTSNIKKRNVNVILKSCEMKLRLIKGEITQISLIPRFTLEGDGRFIFSCGSNSILRKSSDDTAWKFDADEIDDINEIASSLSSIKNDKEESKKKLEENASGLCGSSLESISNTTPTTKLNYSVLQNYLTGIHYGVDNTNLNDVLDLLLRMIEKRLITCNETLLTEVQLQIKCTPKTQSTKSNFSSFSGGWTWNGVNMCFSRNKFWDLQEEFLTLLIFLWKIINAKLELLKILSNSANNYSFETSLAPISDQPNKDLTIGADNGTRLCENLIKLIQLQLFWSGKFVPKYYKDIIFNVIRLLAVIVTRSFTLQTLRNFICNGGIIFYLKIKVGVDIVNSSLDVISACITNCDNLNWLCHQQLRKCHISRLGSLCDDISSSSVTDEVKLRLLDKIIDLVTKLLKHSHGRTMLIREFDACNCSSEVLHQLILALSLEVKKHQLNAEKLRFKVLKKGIFCLFLFASFDPHFHVRKGTREVYFIGLIHQMILIYRYTGTRMTVKEVEIYKYLDDTRTIAWGL